MVKSAYDKVLTKKGSKCICPFCRNSCEGGARFLETGKLVDVDINGCKHYDGWDWDHQKKIMSHYFNK